MRLFSNSGLFLLLYLGGFVLELGRVELGKGFGVVGGGGGGARWLPLGGGGGGGSRTG